MRGYEIGLFSFRIKWLKQRRTIYNFGYSLHDYSQAMTTTVEGVCESCKTDN
jgi:hypothetical protein